jgi:hypothetical protein
MHRLMTQHGKVKRFLSLHKYFAFESMHSLSPAASQQRFTRQFQTEAFIMLSDTVVGV